MTTGFIGHDIGFVGDDYSGMTIRGWLLVSSGMTIGFIGHDIAFIGEDYSGMTVGFIGDDGLSLPDVLSSLPA